MCDVDLKTIHNWCDRSDDPTEPAGLECFRTPGGHLRFTHPAVLRFLTRWGYPIPDALLQDRPHVLLVEPDARARAAIVAGIGLQRPGYTDGAEATLPTPSNDATSTETHLGLWATPRYYLHLWGGPSVALVSFGERVGAGAPPDLIALSLPLEGIDAAAWIRTVRAHVDEDPPRIVLLGSEVNATLANEEGVVAVAPRANSTELAKILDEHAAALQARVSERAAQGRVGRPRRRIPMAPKEPIYVASQVASIWNVDLKTVHNWVEKGDMEAFRTPGRHLRFRRRSLLSFLRRYNMEIPADLAPDRPRVMIVDGDAARAARIQSTLDTRFDVLTHTDPVAALAELGTYSVGADCVDAVVVTFPAPGINDLQWLSGLLEHPDTHYARVVVIGSDTERQRSWQDLGVHATVSPDALHLVSPVLEQCLGLARK
jgi:excisionase family DNA binding protein